MTRDKGLTERIIFKATKTQRQTLEAFSETSGIPLSEIVRRAVDAYLKAVKK